MQELAFLFLKLGAIGFGGPAAHIALMEEEVVRRRQWLSREHFLDLVGATNLIPGPNSTEMAIHVGYIRAGWRGLLIAGISFILPAVLITLGFAWAYAKFGTLPRFAPFLFGIKPVVLTIIFFAVVRLGKTALTCWQLLVIGLGVMLASLAGINEVVALFIGGIVGMLWLGFVRVANAGHGNSLFLALVGATASTWLRPLEAVAVFFTANSMAATAGISLWKLALFFLEVGAVLFGSGYVLIAFLQGGLVEEYGWLTQQQLLDAIAIGQLTPGPLLSTATFIGYQLSGVSGALVATIGVFLPSFFFVALLNPLIPRFRKSIWASAFLDAINISAVGLMLAVAIHLAPATLVNWQSWLIAIAAGIVIMKMKTSPAWLILGGALTGYVLVQL